MDLTIIIPTYNRNSSVAECVAALDHNAAEILVIDDGSEQPVAVPGVTARVIRHPRHRGRSAAINTGLKAASHNLVLIMWDDIYAAPDMVARLVDEFSQQSNPRLCLRPRVIWDPDLPFTLTMKWMEDTNKFSSPLLFSKSHVIEYGGYDENFTRTLEDLELQLRLARHGFRFNSVESAVGFHNNVLKIRDLIEREFMDGVSAVLVHSKFPDYMPQVDDIQALTRNEAQSADAESAIDEIALLEQSGSNVLPDGADELYAHVCRHYFMHGIFEGLKDIGGIRPMRGNSGTVAIYRHASYLETLGEWDEARRLFRLVLHRPDEGHWDGAEYHLGCIETQLGNESVAHGHFVECLRLNPGHSKALQELNKPAHYREVETNVYEAADPLPRIKILFVLFGDLRQVIHAFPVIAALRERFRAETTWLTSPEFVSLARESAANSVRESEPRGILPWQWIHAQGFTHVFFPEAAANQEEWERSGLHAIDFMALKCGVRLKNHTVSLEPSLEAQREAEEFLRAHDLKRGAFVTACVSSTEARHWPRTNLMKLSQQIGAPVVTFTRKSDTAVTGTVPCLEKPYPVIAALIGQSCCYVGGESGISWLAATTETPMAIFYDPLNRTRPSIGFSELLRAENKEIKEWDLYTSVPSVLEFVESKVPAAVTVV
jgi:glycosyltransferase involved in cell wall biosynthesis